VEGVFPIKGTIFLEFQLFLGIPAVFAGSIVAPFALAALQGYQFNHLLLACHKSTSYVKLNRVLFPEKRRAKLPR